MFRSVKTSAKVLEIHNPFVLVDHTCCGVILDCEAQGGRFSFRLPCRMT